MKDAPDTEIVLQALVAMWLARLPRLREYLQSQFGYSLDRPYGCKRLIIAMMADGDMKTNNIGGLYSSKWVLVDTSLEAVSLDFAYKEMYDTDQSGDLYVSPSFLFYLEGNEVLLSERYGPGLKHRLRGRVVSPAPSPTIEWTTIWSSAPG